MRKDFFTGPDASGTLYSSGKLSSSEELDSPGGMRDDDLQVQKMPGFPRLLFAAPHSGSGKTLITCGILRLLQRKGFRPAAFKCGPDYIDPMFHREVLGVPSRNLDTFFSPDGGAQKILSHAMQAHQSDIAVIEGVMGYFDGTGPSGMMASSFDLAMQTQTPVVLVVNAKGMGRSIIPLLRGFADYESHVRQKECCRDAESHVRQKECCRDAEGHTSQTECCRDAESHASQTECCRDAEGHVSQKKRPRDSMKRPAGPGIRGVILNRISPGMAPVMKKWIEEETGLAVVGYVPQDESLAWGSRHLGLLLPEEVADFQSQMDHLADVLEKTLDMDVLLSIAGISTRNEPGADTEEISVSRPAPKEGTGPADPGRTYSVTGARPDPVRIAVALDEAFNFYYEDNLELLREYGAEPVFFSPVHDRVLPAADGLILGGGYPELYAQALADNREMKEQIRARARAGLPILAECGGFMYLQESLELPADDKKETDRASSGPAEELVDTDAKAKAAAAGLRSFPMCGVLKGSCRKTDHLVRFGYIEIGANPGKACPDREGIPACGQDGSPGYLRPGENIRGHEFHYFDSTDNGDFCRAVKPGGKRSWDCMVVQDNIMAGFPHLYYRSDPAFLERFLERCRGCKSPAEDLGAVHK